MQFLPYLAALEPPALDLDITLLMQISLFVLVLLVLRKYVLIPYLDARDARDALTVGAREEAAELQKKAADAEGAYDAKRQAAYAKAESERSAVVAKANAEASAYVEKERAQIQRDIEERQSAFDAQLAEARRHAEPEIEAISAQIARKVLV